MTVRVEPSFCSAADLICHLVLPLSCIKEDVMGRPSQVFLCLLGFVFLSASRRLAQVPTGTITGTVFDEQGTPLPGVAVEATSPRLVGKAATVTDANGDYRLFALSPGAIQVHALPLPASSPSTRDGIVVSARADGQARCQPPVRCHRRADHRHRQIPPHRRQDDGQGHDPDQGHVPDPAQGTRL